MKSKMKLELPDYIKVKIKSQLEKELKINPFFIKNIFCGLIEEPNKKILMTRKECEIFLLKSILLEIIDTAGLTKFFKITDDEFVYVPNGSAFCFAYKEKECICSMWIEEADSLTQES
jgi:hypothetical protein